MLGFFEKIFEGWLTYLLNEKKESLLTGEILVAWRFVCWLLEEVRPILFDASWRDWSFHGRKEESSDHPFYPGFPQNYLSLSLPLLMTRNRSRL